MTWMTWRQHRTEFLVLTGFLALLAGVLLVHGLPMHALFPEGAAACATDTLTDACMLAVNKLGEKFSFAVTLSILLNAVPFAIGAFLGAPLLARELEAGTWQLAWTQAVPRMRWLAVKLVSLAGLTALLTLAFSTIITWYRVPLDTFYGRLGTAGYDVEGVVPVAYGLFAFALATAAGVLLRRSIAGLAVALIVFVVARVLVAGLARPAFAEPVRLVQEISVNTPGIQIGTDRRSDWVIEQTFLDRAGDELDDSTLNNLADEAAKAGQPVSAYLHSNGVQRAVDYHPADRFWDFQLLEAGLFAGAAALLVGLVVWRVKARAF